MTDVLTHHYETDSSMVQASLRNDPNYEQIKVEEFFNDITWVADSPIIFAFGGTAFDLIQKIQLRSIQSFKLYHHAFTMSKEKFREDVLQVPTQADMI